MGEMAGSFLIHMIRKGNFPFYSACIKEPHLRKKMCAFIQAGILCIKKSRIQNFRAFQSLSSS